ncbi:hypothetical protein DMENIID0001_027840 [Sergentomyia squamirostris]
MSLFVTHVEPERGGNFLRIFGQLDQNEPMKIESNIHEIILHQPRIVRPEEIQVKLRCLTKYEDGQYYRAQIIKVVDRFHVSVLFIDYGNTAIVSVKELLSLHSQTSQALYLMGTPPQANEYILARITGPWSQEQLISIREEICNEQHPYNIEDKVDRIPIIGVLYKNVDYSQYLIDKLRIGVFITVKSQRDSIQMGQLVSSHPSIPRTTPDKIVNLAGMKYLQSANVMKKNFEPKTSTNPFMNSIDAPKISPNLRLKIPNTASLSGSQSETPTFFKHLTLPAQSMYEVRCSHVEDGYKLFHIHLKQKDMELRKLQQDLSQTPLKPLQQPTIGTPCIVRYELDSRLYRGIITNITPNSCVVSFVDYGYTYTIPCGYIFEIPGPLMGIKMFKVSCTLSQSDELGDNFTLKDYFQQLILNKDLHMKLLSNRGFVQTCELYMNNTNIIDELKHIQIFGLQYEPTVRLSADFKGLVIVRYVDSPKKFYVQLVANTSEHDSLMDKLSRYCQKRPKVLSDMKTGALCAVFFEDDLNWYRGKIVEVKSAEIVSVMLVDYGNIINVSPTRLQEIGYQFTKLPPQVYECCIKGFENVFDITDSSGNAFEMLVENSDGERKILKMHIVDFLTEDTLLVNLFDEAQIPPVNISKSLCKSQLPYKDYVNMFERRQTITSNKRESFGRTEQVTAEATNFSTSSNVDTYGKSDNRIVQWNNGSSTPERAFESNQIARSHQNNFDDRHHQNKATGGDKWNANDKRSINNNNIVGEKPQKRQLVENSKGLIAALSAKHTNQRFVKNIKVKGFERRDTQARDSKSNGDRGGERGSDRNNDRGGDRAVRNNVRGATRETRSHQAQNDHADNSQDWDDSGSASQEPKTVESSISLSSTDFRAADINFDIDFDVIFTFWMDPDEFYVQIKTNLTDYDAMQKEIQRFYNGKKPIGALHYENGWCVIARSSRDELLHRAKVCDYNKKLNKYKVLFVDRGYRGVVTPDFMWPITEAFLKLPTMAIRCSLANNVTLDFDQQNIFNHMDKYVNDAMNIKCKFNAVKDKIYAVTVTVDCGNLLQAFVNDGLVKMPTENVVAHADVDIDAHADIEINAQLLVGQTILVKLMNIESLEKFEIMLEYYNVTLPAMYYNVNYAKIIDMNIVDLFKTLEGKFYPVKVIRVESNNTLRLAILSDIFFEEPPMICPQVIHQTKSLVLVAFVESLNVIYIQMAKHSDPLTQQLEDMYEFYEPTDPSVFDPANIVLKNILAVKSSDDNWYRGQVVNINGDDVTVKYIDYGNKETVKKNNLRLLSDKFSTYSSYATRIFMPLECISDGDSAIAELSKIILNGIPELKILKSYRGEWIGELNVNECSLAEILEKKGLAKVTDTENICLIIDRYDDLTVEENSIEKEGVSAFVTHIDHPTKFYLQDVSIQDDLFKLQDDIQIVGESLPPLSGGKTGSLCLGKYSVDGLWYRARILDTTDDMTALQYIDYGNMDVITDASFLREISDAFADIKPYARLCSLPLIPKGHQDDWSQAAVDIMHKLYQDQKVKYTVISERYNDCYVHLHVEDDVNAEKLLLLKCLADPLSMIEPNSIGFVSHINSLEDFYMQMEKDTDDLEKVCNSLNEITAVGEDVTNMEEGKMYAALFPDDNSWYRAKLIHSTADGLEVIFVDYGNTAITNSIKDLPNKLAELPIMSKKCCLEPSPHDGGKWPENAQKKFVEMAQEGATCFTIVPMAPGETTTVRLFLDGINIIETLQRIKESQSSSQSMDISEEPQYEEAKGFVCHINSLEDFYLHLNNNQENLDRINDHLGIATFNPAPTRDIGTICAATFSTDNCVYRAKIEAAEDVNQYRVCFIDYGNTTVTSDIWELSQEIQTIEPLAIRCCLKKNTRGDWADQAVERFREIAKCGKTQFRIVFLDKSISPALVQLFLDDQEISLEDIGQDFSEEASENDITMESLESRRIVEEIVDNGITRREIQHLTDEIVSMSMVRGDAQMISEEIVDMSISQCTEDFNKFAQVSTPTSTDNSISAGNNDAQMINNGTAVSDSGASSSQSEIPHDDASFTGVVDK